MSHDKALYKSTDTDTIIFRIVRLLRLPQLDVNFSFTNGNKAIVDITLRPHCALPLPLPGP